ncbi:MAG: 2-hydroxyglutaryl-CoA dehydratase [Eubacteriaceae bacterium]|nr:2-hydroxyglutaryl-CoA dehydratase [Eubacteriaceae bacterium]
MKESYFLGIDIGSTTSKCILLNSQREIIGSSLVSAGTGTTGPQKAYEDILEKANLTAGDISFTVATGYGRIMFTEANDEMSELSCHAKGVHHIFPDVHTIIDIGGQDAKVISINDAGKVINFVMNDKCAAGTGRFLDVMATILQININDLEIHAREAVRPAKISSTCTVFAESEVISQLSSGENVNNIVAGICESVAGRVASLAKRVGIKEEICMSGGVAKNGGVRDAMSKSLGAKLQYSPKAQYMGALGAALFAYDKLNI